MRFEEAARHIREAGDVRTWDMAAIGEGESTLLSLVDAKGDPAGITGLAYRDATGNLIRTGKAKQRDLNDFPGCIYVCAYQRELPPAPRADSGPSTCALARRMGSRIQRTVRVDRRPGGSTSGKSSRNTDGSPCRPDLVSCAKTFSVREQPRSAAANVVGAGERQKGPTRRYRLSWHRSDGFEIRPTPTHRLWRLAKSRP
ncbi:hypothetical protein [Actinoplanes sp. NPDC049802]|uniref:hypothetical protein n=1 Tax=Actinoplanes sp. NPDC049802 TaxID=3154742 RepID=UPI0033C493A2